MSVTQTSQTLLYTCDWSGEQEERTPLSGPPPSWKVISSGDEATPIPQHMSWKEASRRLAFPGHEVKVTTVE
jgi:hypothetical protein